MTDRIAVLGAGWPQGEIRADLIEQRDELADQIARALASTLLDGQTPTGLADSDALNAIAHMLRDPDWSSGMLEDICDLVADTGRDVAGDGTPTWDRH